MTIKLYPHQLTALEKMHNGCVLKGGVGSGKSATAIAYFWTRVCGGEMGPSGPVVERPLPTPRPLYIITTAKKRDDCSWLGEAAMYAIGSDASSSFCGIKVTVDSWNNIINYKDVKDAFFIFDEQRLVGSGAWVKAFIRIAKANQWILLSATPGDNWLDYCPVFIANGWYKNRTDFLRTHVVYNNFSKFPKIDRYVETGVLEKRRRAVLVEMPYARHTVRHVHNYIVQYDEARFDRVHKDRWHVYEERPLKDVGEMFQVMRKVVNSDPERLGAVMKLMEKHPRLIVFYNFNYELDALRTLSTTTGVEVAEWNGQKHQEIPSTDRWLYLVQYTAGAEGWNCISTDATVFYSLNYSYKINEQAKGRIDRMNTPYVDLHYYVLRSMSYIDTQIMKSLAGKRNFNEVDCVASWS